MERAALASRFLSPEAFLHDANEEMLFSGALSSHPDSGAHFILGTEDTKFKQAHRKVLLSVRVGLGAGSTASHWRL